MNPSSINTVPFMIYAVGNLTGFVCMFVISFFFLLFVFPLLHEVEVIIFLYTFIQEELLHE